VDLLGVIVGKGGQAKTELDEQPDVRIDLFVDYMCPFCRRFERTQGPALQQVVDEGHAQLITHPISFLDRFSRGTEYSTRSAAAAYGVATLAPEAFGAFSSALFADQPREGSEGLDDEAIAGHAITCGADPQAAAQLTQEAYQAMALKSTRDALDLGVQGTPTLLISRAGVGEALWDMETPIPVLVRQFAEA
jgi:protein-disulfide isomerase